MPYVLVYRQFSTRMLSFGYLKLFEIVCPDDQFKSLIFVV